MSKKISIELSDEVAELLEKLSVNVNQKFEDFVKEVIEKYIREKNEWEDESIPEELQKKYSCTLDELMKGSHGTKHKEIYFDPAVGKEV